MGSTLRDEVTALRGELKELREAKPQTVKLSADDERKMFERMSENMTKGMAATLNSWLQEEFAPLRKRADDLEKRLAQIRDRMDVEHVQRTLVERHP